MAPDLREVYNVLEIYSRQHVDLYVRGLLKTPAPLYRNALGIVEMVRTDGAKATLIQLRQWFKEAEQRTEPTPAAPPVQSNPVGEVIDYFADGWGKLYSGAYLFTAADRGILAKLTKAHGAATLKIMLSRYFASTIPFFMESKHGVKQFIGSLHQWTTDAQTTGRHSRTAAADANRQFNQKFDNLKGGRVKV